MHWPRLTCLSAICVATGVIQSLGAQVTITPSATTVAKGGQLTFTVAVVPDTYVQQVTLAVAGESGSVSTSTSPYALNWTFSNPGDAVSVTATVEYNNSDPSDQASTAVDVIGVGITGSASPIRGNTVSYIAQSSPSGKAVTQFNWSYASATFQDDDANQDKKSVWSGRMVVSGTLTCTALISGVWASESLPVSIVPRNWVTPITCAQDNEPDWGEIPTAEDTELGLNRDMTSDDRQVFFIPRNGALFTPARTLTQVTSGPCTGIWYVYSTTLKCERETVINRYIKPTGPAIDGMTFSEANAYCFDPAVFLQAVKNHEYRGTPATFKSPYGHQGRTELQILEIGSDPRARIESRTATTMGELETAVQNAIVQCEAEVVAEVLDEYELITVGPNWGGSSAPGSGTGSRWIGYWSGCDYGPDKF